MENKICSLEEKYGLQHNTHDLKYIMSLIKLENEDKKDDAQRLMVWCCLAGMLLYPFIVLLTEYFHLKDASTLIADMANLYFVTTSAIIMTYFGTNTIAKIKNEQKNNKKRDDKDI